MNSGFAGKVALVTGGASGIGRATALAFAKEGASVWVCDTDKAGGEDTCALIRGGAGFAEFFPCDISSPGQVRAMVQGALSRFGRLDFACNNAGIEGAPAPTADSDEKDWDRVLNVNLKGAWLCMREEIREMLKRGGGSIVNIASIAGVVGFASSGAYVASKHGIVGLTRTAALEYGRLGIRVNAVAPGVIRTAMVDRFTHGDAALLEKLGQAAPMGRVGKPEEIASAVLWLCSEGASFTTGHALVVDGGWVAQ